MKPRSNLSLEGIEGALLTLAPLCLLLAFLGENVAQPEFWRILIACLSGGLCFGTGFILYHHPRLSQILGVFSCGLGLVAAFPYLQTNPLAALIGIIFSLIFIFWLFESTSELAPQKNPLKRRFNRTWWAVFCLPAMLLFYLSPGLSESPFALLSLPLAFVFSQLIFMRWVWGSVSKFYLLLPGLALLILSLMSVYQVWEYLFLPILLIGLLEAILLSQMGTTLFPSKSEYWWEFFINHPARLLLSTFFLLCLLGSLLLILPLATTQEIRLIDAMFTAVSAVCVTGLIVLDTPKDFTLTGQFFIILLIQLGGLGIMSITTVALHSLGHRISLKQERILTSMTDTDHKDLVHSLKLILGFTFSVEGVGAMLLSLGFYLDGKTALEESLWQGIFTAISAFCNAGFALQSDSLISYQSQPLILYTVATLIILGGLAPGICLLIPAWIRGKRIPVAARIALFTTGILLCTGTLFMLAFEWNGLLAGLAWEDKLHNAWFQSVTLRTAGFNSVDLTKVTPPMYLIMLFMMAVGGSPGGTAGGLKTTTLGILFMTFWAHITNRERIILQARYISPQTVYRALTIVVSGVIIWFIVILMLELTQQIPVLELMFEATSAMATVGLSIGATARLDEIGKLIIILAMFAGRVGPMTLFMLLNKEQKQTSAQFLEAKITLT